MRGALQRAHSQGSGDARGAQVLDSALHLEQATVTDRFAGLLCRGPGTARRHTFVRHKRAKCGYAPATATLGATQHLRQVGSHQAQRKNSCRSGDTTPTGARRSSARHIAAATHLEVAAIMVTGVLGVGERDRGETESSASS